MASVEKLVYTLVSSADRDAVSSKVWAFDSAETVPIQRSVKTRDKRRRRGKRRVREMREIDLKPMVERLEVRAGEGAVVIEFVSIAHEGRFAKPKDIIALLELDPTATRVLKRDTVLRTGNIAIEEQAEC